MTNWQYFFILYDKILYYICNMKEYKDTEYYKINMNSIYGSYSYTDDDDLSSKIEELYKKLKEERRIEKLKKGLRKIIDMDDE